MGARAGSLLLLLACSGSKVLEDLGLLEQKLQAPLPALSLHASPECVRQRLGRRVLTVDVQIFQQKHSFRGTTEDAYFSCTGGIILLKPELFQLFLLLLGLQPESLSLIPRGLCLLCVGGLRWQEAVMRPQL